MLNLHTHSVYSYEKSICRINDIIDANKKLGNKSFCITDINSVISFVKAFQGSKNSGMKFIPGCEFLIKPDESIFKCNIDDRIAFLRKECSLKRTSEEDRIKYENEISKLESIDSIENHNIILIAKNQTGFNNLLKLFSSREFYKNEELKIITNDSLQFFKEGLICIFAKNSPIDYYLDKDENKIKQIIDFYSYLFKDDFYLSLTKEEKRESYISLPIKKIITNEVFYKEKKDEKKFKIYYGSMNLIDEWNLEKDGYFLTDDEIKNKFFTHLSNEMIEEAYNNIAEIENSIEEITLPKGAPLKDRSEELTKLCMEGWEKKRKGTKYEKESLERLNYELDIIKSKNFSQYFIKIINIINTCKKLNVLVGPSRGSGGGSEICYLTGIIEIDPLKYNLLFERFLNPGRNNFPDIDIDMASYIDNGDGTFLATRNVLVQKLLDNGIFSFAKYISNEMKATTIVLFKALARYYEFPFYEANKITKMYKEKFEEKEYSGWFKEAIETLGLDYEDYWDVMEDKMTYLYELNGIPHNSSIAASGVIMSEEIPILPLSGEAIMFDGADLESLGYIKFDLLSISTLDQIQCFDGANVEWNPVETLNTPIGNFKMDEKIQLKNGESILVSEMYDRIQAGESFEI